MRRSRHVLLFSLSAAVLFLFWALLTSGFKGQEMLVGTGAALLAALLFMFVRIETGSILQPAWRDLIQVWRLPWYLMTGSWEITVVLFEDLLGIRKAGSHFRSVPFEAGADGDLRMVTRRALAMAYTTVAPNFIVIGVDAKRGQLLFHQLRRSGIPIMTQRLGAQQ